MNKLMTAVVAALSFVALAQEPEAKGAVPRRGPGRGPMVTERGKMPPRGIGGMAGDPALTAVMNPKIAEKVGISEEVRKQIRKIDADSRKAGRDLQHRLHAAMAKQSKLLREAKPDEAAVMAAIDELSEARKAQDVNSAKRTIAIKALLTPEQLEKAVEEFKKGREERRMKRAEAAPKPEAEAKPEAAPKAE